MRRHEEHFHTPEQIAAHLDDALAIIHAAGVEDELKVPAFIKVLELLAAKQVFFEQAQPVALDPRLLNPPNHTRRH